MTRFNTISTGAKCRPLHRLLATTALVAAFASPALAQDVVIQGGDFTADGAPAIEADLVTGNITVDAGNVTTTGDDAPGIEVVTTDGGVDITLSGGVSTAGDSATGISAFGADGVTMAVDGAVTTLGYRSAGVSATSETGDLDITLTGGVSTLGVGATAIDLISFDGDIRLETGDVSTVGNGSVGISVDALGGMASVIGGAVATTGDFATAVAVSGEEGAMVTLLGSVSTSGQNATGVSLLGDRVLLDFVDVTVDGLFSQGVELDGRLVGLVGRSVHAGGDHVSAIDIRVRDGLVGLAVETVSTSGSDSDAVTLFAVNSELHTQFGTVTTAGDSATGIAIGSDGGPITLTADSIATEGFGSIGLDIQIDAADTPSEPGAPRHGDISVQTGSVLTRGERAHGIDVNIDRPADPQDFGPTAVTINAGSIAVSGDYARGLRFRDRSGLGSLNVSVDSVSTQGVRGRGVVLRGGARDVTFVSTGRLATLGNGADALLVASGGDVDITANEIITRGHRAWGVFVRQVRSDAQNGDDTYFNIDVESVSTTGDNSHGIQVMSSDAHVDVRATDIETDGPGAAGILVSTETGAIAIRTSGSVVANGFFSSGVTAVSDTGSLDILVNDVTVGGNYSTGVVTGSRRGTDVDVLALGDVQATGLNSSGIIAYSWADLTAPGGPEAGHVTVDVFGVVSARGAVDHSHAGTDHLGHGVVVQGASSDVTIGSTGHLESANGFAFYSRDLLLNGPEGESYLETEDTLTILGSIAGDVSFGRGDDRFLIFQGADISQLGLTLGGEGSDLLQFAGWTGEIDPGRFDSFEELAVVEGADVAITAEAPAEWSLANIELGDASLRLGNGITLRGTLDVFDFERPSSLNFFDAGASVSRFIGDVYAPEGLIISLVDGAGDDAGQVTGNVEGDLVVGIDLGIGNGGIMAADSFRIDGALAGDIVLSLVPYLATAGDFDGTLIEVTGDHGAITLANGPIAWGGEVFDISLSGGGASQAKTYASAAGQTTSVGLVSLGYTPDAAGALALPAIIDALDTSLHQVRASRRGSARDGASAALWGEVRFDAFEGDVHGVGYDTEQTAVLLGADLVNAQAAGGRVTGTLMFHTAESHSDLAQAALAMEHVDVDTNALGFALGWTSETSGRYVDLVAWGTDRSLDLESVTLDSQGLAASLEVGTHFDVSASARLQPLVQVVWTDADIDSFTDAASGGDIRPGAVRSLHVRAGAVYSQSLSETWELEATAIADLNRRNSGATVLATGYSDATHLAGMGAEAGLRLTGSVGNWQMYGDVTGRWATGADGADGVGGRIGLSRRF